MNIDIKVNAHKFEKALKKALAVSKKQASKIVFEASKFFILSASKYTNPAMGKAKIPKKAYKRKIEKLIGFNYGAGEIGWRKLGERKKKKDFILWKVLFRTPKKKGRRFFKDKEKAKEFQKIKMRGIGKAGWLIGLTKLGFTIPQHVTPEILAKANEINQVRKRLDVDSPGIEITNSVDSISKHSPFSAKMGQSKAANRINHLTREIKKKIADAGNK